MQNQPTYREKLLSRIAELENRHSELTKQKSDFDKISDLNFAHNLAESKGIGTQAALVWDLKCEVENCLKLYDTNIDSIPHLVYRTYEYVMRCIDSCEDMPQFETAENMVLQFGLIHKTIFAVVEPLMETLNGNLHTKRVRLGFA